MISRKKLQKEWAEYLSTYHWQWFVTLTFRFPPHPEQAFKSFRYWVHYLNRKLYGTRYYKKTTGIFWTLALEYHQSGVIHFHALVGDVEDLNIRFSRKTAAEKWNEIAGYARIYPINDQMKAVTNYVSKYVVKGGEIELSDGLQHFVVQEHVGRL